MFVYEILPLKKSEKSYNCKIIILKQYAQELVILFCLSLFYFLNS